MNPNIDDELREQILTEFKQVHKLAPADYTENCTNVVMSMVTNKIKEAELRGRIDELGGVKEHHESIPLPWEVGTGPYIEGRLTQLTNQHKGEQDDE